MSTVSKYVTDAFKSLGLLEDTDFDLGSKDSFRELRSFLDDDVPVDTEVIDLDAEQETELKDSYVGDAILECPVCHANLFKTLDQIVLSDEADICNVDEPCPVCGQIDGFRILGKVAPFKEETEEEAEVTVETEPEEEVSVEVKDKEEEEIHESLTEAKGAEDLMIYQFPSLDRRDIREAKRHGLRDITWDFEDDNPNGDTFLQGEFADLFNFAQDYLGYTLVNGYLYDYHMIPVDLDSDGHLIEESLQEKADLHKVVGTVAHVINQHKDEYDKAVNSGFDARSIKDAVVAFLKAHADELSEGGKKELAKFEGMPFRNMGSLLSTLGTMATGMKVGEAVEEKHVCEVCGKDPCECKETVEEGIGDLFKRTPEVYGAIFVNKGGKRKVAVYSTKPDQFKKLQLFKKYIGDSGTDGRYEIQKYTDGKKGYQSCQIATLNDDNPLEGARTIDSIFKDKNTKFFKSLTPEQQYFYGESLTEEAAFGRSNILEFPNGDYMYVGIDITKGTIYAGAGTNAGIMRMFEIPFEHDWTIDENIAELYDHICSERPELMVEEESLKEAVTSHKYTLQFEPYERYGGSSGLKKATFAASTLADAVKKVASKLSLYVEAEQILPEGKTKEEYAKELEGYDADQILTAEEAISSIESSNGDGDDYIVLFEDTTAGIVYIEGYYEDEEEDWDDYEESLEKPALKRSVNEAIEKDRKLVPGDTVVVKGTRAVIKDIHDQHVFGDEIDIEFTDDKGVLRNWKSAQDGGTVIYKEQLKESIEKAEIETEDQVVKVEVEDKFNALDDFEPDFSNFDAEFEAEAEEPAEEVEATEEEEEVVEESLTEGIENATIETEDQVIEVSTEEKEEVAEEVEAPEEEMVAPLSDQDIQEIEVAQEEPVEEPAEEEIPTEEEAPEEEVADEEEFDFDEIQEESFNRLANKFLTKVYSNIKSFQLTEARAADKHLQLEGTINFKSGKTRTTTFQFEAAKCGKGKLRFNGLNETLTDKPNAFVIKARVNNKQLQIESLRYNYPAKTSSTLTESVAKTVKGLVR